MLEWQRCRSLIRTYTIASFAVLFAIFFVFGQAPAQQQDAEQKAQQSQQSQELQKAKQQKAKYGQKLKKLQNATLENNPEVKTELENRLSKLRELQKKKFNKIVSENATAREKMMAQRRVMQDEEIRKKQQAIRDYLIEAMKKEDPKAEEYFNKLKKAQKNIQEIRRQQKQKGQPQGVPQNRKQ